MQRGKAGLEERIRSNVCVEGRGCGLGIGECEGMLDSQLRSMGTIPSSIMGHY